MYIDFILIVSAAMKAYEVLQKFDKMASGGIETSSNRETLTLLDRLFKNKPPSDPGKRTRYVD